MVPTIAEQVKNALEAMEEERCKVIEAESPGKRVKRREVSMPKIRSGPCALCQDPDLLLMVDQFDFDLSDRAFRAYCEARGVLGVAGVAQSALWGFMNDTTLTREDFGRDERLSHAMEFNGSRHKYSESEVEVGWRIVRIGRAKLQDCWELFNTAQRD